MTKYLIVLAVIALSLGNSKYKMISTSPAQAHQTKTTIVQKGMLLGEFEKEDLQQTPFSRWFQPQYDNYTPDSESMEIIKKNIGDYEIKLFMGTWCGDSRRETPKFLKILDEAGYDYDHLEMYAVDRSKTTPTKAEVDLNIHRVPTMIFYKDGKEVNRFVEYPQGLSLEEDMARILSDKEYKNSYAD